MNKPYFQNGKFYNNINDSLKSRITNLFKVSLSLIYLKATLKRGRKRYFGGHKFQAQSWKTLSQVPESAELPTITWISHATFLIQIGGINILTDPAFFNVSPFFARMMKPAIGINRLPKIDAIIISHNHRDHMDRKSLLLLKKHNPTVFVPTGDAPWLEKHGFKFIEKTWWQTDVIKSSTSNPIIIDFLPASHWSGRSLFDLNKSLWGSWMISYNGFKIYFAGDTAYANHFEQIGKTFAPIDIAIMPIGPNNPRKLISDVHVSTEESVQAFIELNAKHFIPMHWGTFKSGSDNFLDPIVALNKHWQEKQNELKNKHLHIVKFGEKKVFGKE